jgi:single-strand DNA-binding protein
VSDPLRGSSSRRFVERQWWWLLDRGPQPIEAGPFENRETGTMLRVTLMGHLGSDAELRHSAKDTPIASFRVAVNQVRANAAGEREESTEWFRINVTGRQAEYASGLQKGQRVLVDGRLQISHFQRRDGTPGIGLDVWADEVQNVSARTTADADDARVPVGAPRNAVGDEPPDDDLPF